MGPKFKSSKIGWEECKTCSCLLPSIDSGKHVEGYHGSHREEVSVAAEERQSPRTFSSKLTHGYIRRQILHGFAKENQNKVDEVSRLSQSLRDDIVLLHSSAMALCNIAIASLVLVWSESQKFALLKAWPAKEGSQVDIGLCTRMLDLLSCKSQDVLHVQRFTVMEQRAASELSLKEKDSKHFYGSEEFQSYFLNIMDGKLVTVGASCCLHYYGQLCELTITDINQESGKLKANESDQCMAVCENLSELSLNELECSSLELNSCHDIPPSSAQNASLDRSMTLTSTPKHKKSMKLCSCELTKPKNLTGTLYFIHSLTKVKFTELENELTSSELKKADSVSFDDIGGLKKQTDEIRKLLFLPSANNSLFSFYGLKPPRGIIMYGPSGTGKTLIGRAVASIMKNSFILINGPELYSKFYGETEGRLRSVFNEAIIRAPSVIFIDEIDSLCPKRDGSSTQQEQRVVATLLTLMDNLPTNAEDRVVVLAATNKIDALDLAMRRPGRLDREIEIGIPTSLERAEILTKLLKRMKHNLNENEINEIASRTHGFVGADLTAVCTQAGLIALTRICGNANHSSESPNVIHSETITFSDVSLAAKDIKPSALREVFLEVPKVHWDDVGGQKDLKHKLKQAVEWPLKHPEVFKRMGITPPKGVLMYGPPGCSKTLIAKALATESGLNFIAIKGPELFSKWVGESERAIREVFRKARAAAPSIVFFDEIDALASERGSSSGSSNVGDRVLAQLLSEMDGLEKLRGVTIIASTNRPDMIDKALLRPGRLDRLVYVPLPDSATRKDIFEIQFRTIPVGRDVLMNHLVTSTEGYSGAEVVAVCREAALKAMEENLEATEVVASHFTHALHVIKPRISRELIQFYETYHIKKQNS